MPDARTWAVEDLPDLSGRVAVVTGGNSGLGLETARALSGRGAHVVIACRSPEKGEDAALDIRGSGTKGPVEVMPLDLANLASVRAFADAFRARYARLDALCNNAGVMALPRRTTADGFEMQIGTNHLGHFALTALLFDVLRATPGARVVNVSSTMHRIGRMNFDDLHGERRYAKWPAYGQSKLANLLFTFELARRCARAGIDLTCAAAHPGYAATNLQAAGPRMEGSAWMERITGLGNRLLAQTAAMGALPTIYAAADPSVRSGEYFGPSGPGEMWGPPRRVGCSRRAQDATDAARLFELSEALTGVRCAGLAAA